MLGGDDPIGGDALPEINLQPAIDSILKFPEEVRTAVFAPPVGISGDAQMLAMSGRQP